MTIYYKSSNITDVEMVSTLETCQQSLSCARNTISTVSASMSINRLLVANVTELELRVTYAVSWEVNVTVRGTWQVEGATDATLVPTD